MRDSDTQRPEHCRKYRLLRKCAGFQKGLGVGKSRFVRRCDARDQVSFFLCQETQGQAGMWLSVFVDDVDTLYREYQLRGAVIRQKPTNFPWGVREMNVEDPDGHRLRMGSPTNDPADDIPLCET